MLLDTYTAQIYMAGDIHQAKQTCRMFCARGLCVTIEPLDFIYTGGEESGFRIGLINYPKFPSEPDKIKDLALELAGALCVDLFQDSYTVVCSDRTIWHSTRQK